MLIPHLEPLLPSLHQLIYDNDSLEDFSSSSSSYNNILSLGKKPLPIESITTYRNNMTHKNLQYNVGATGVDNGGKDDQHGWCHDMVGDHAVKLNGRTKCFLPPARQGVGPSGGLSYFTFDSRAALAHHGASRNTLPHNSSVDKRHDVIKAELLTSLYEELIVNNRLCQEVARFGESSHLQELISGASNRDGTTAVIAEVICHRNDGGGCFILLFGTTAYSNAHITWFISTYRYFFYM
jgi:hypothetical protein